MNILIDADGCPVVDLTLQIAKQFSIPVVILCDTSHQIEREGAQTLVFDKGADRRPVLIRTILAAKKDTGLSRCLLLAEMVGFEPTCPVKDKTISSL